MAGSLNKVMLIGNLGADPETRSFQNGGKVCNLRIATTDSWKDRSSGEKREKTEWHSVAVFQEGAASYAEQYLRKGSKVFVEGQLETRKWQDQQGNDRYTTEIVVRPFSGNLTGLDSRGGPGGGSGGGGGGGRQEWSDERGESSGSAGGGSDWGRGGGGGSNQSGGGGDKGGSNFADDLDDDIPF